jgi:hypothetical protein
MEQVTERRVSHLVERISVRHFSIHVKGGPSYYDGVSFFGSYRNLRSTVGEEFAARANYPDGGSLTTRILWRRFGGSFVKRVNGDGAGSPKTDIVRWSLAGVFESEPIRWASRVEVTDFCSDRSGDVGAQLPFGGILEMAQLPLASQIQSDGSNTQGNGRGG